MIEFSERIRRIPSYPAASAYQLPPDNDDQQILRMLVRINQSRELVDALADDIHASIADLRKRSAGHAVHPRVHKGHGY